MFPIIYPPFIIYSITRVIKSQEKCNNMLDKI
uniref:Uncharacterized protein n=1 Tax=Siphoviridae sp. ctkyp1 TaxID=2825646 RepID=A0A8S5P3H9_9CAUD|nr:MAG TPA: hypothetical protein [Siphoviridae sp. ctkyp1]DAH50205.1 MAG TPA: hypothetical protein [Caudoviricetes sp.]DAN72739.1 MAG TPA: hypothetical protein [Caudoviricetes sp.]